MVELIKSEAYSFHVSAPNAMTRKNDVTTSPSNWLVGFLSIKDQVSLAVEQDSSLTQL